MNTPQALGYHMPAEWEPHEATWLSWARNPETWPGVSISNIEKIWARMAAELSHGESVHVNVNDADTEARAKKLIAAAGAEMSRIHFHAFITNDAWARDHGPNFVVNEDRTQLALNDWDYNAWGGKYPPFDRDQLIPGQVAEFLKVPKFNPGIVLEGGSIEVNGFGTVLTTESCLLNPNRNPQLNRSQIEQKLKDHLGVVKILWLGDGIVGDDTDGHIDDITRFVSRDSVVTVVEKDPAEENYRPLQENLQRLKTMTIENGQPLQVIELPMPRPLYFQGQRLPASYGNFYIGNEVVLVPVFSESADQEALEILRNLFPARRVVGIDSRELVVGLGAFHCVTQQQPALRQP